MLSPFIAYVSYEFMKIDFKTSFTVLTYLGTMLIILFSNKNNPIKFPKYLFFYLLFIFYVYYSEFFFLDRDFNFKYLVSNHLIGSFNLLFIVENISISKKYYNFLFKTSKIIIILAVLVIFIQQTFDLKFFVRHDLAAEMERIGDNKSRLMSIYSYTGLLANGLSFVPIYLLIVEDLQLKNKRKKVFIWIIVGIFYAVLTKSRWILLNFFMVFFVLLLSNEYKIKSLLTYLVLVPIILLASYITLNIAGVNAEGILKERILESDKADISQTSAGTRILAVQIFNNLYWKNSIFGVGDSKYGMGSNDRSKWNYELRNALRGRSSQIHVGYLSLFYIFGLVGGIFFLAFLILLLKGLYEGAKMTHFWSPFFGVLGFAAANLTLVTYSFFEMGLIFAVLANKYFIQINKNEEHITQNVGYNF